MEISTTLLFGSSTNNKLKTVHKNKKTLTLRSFFFFPPSSFPPNGPKKVQQQQTTTPFLELEQHCCWQRNEIIILLNKEVVGFRHYLFRSAYMVVPLAAQKAVRLRNLISTKRRLDYTYRCCFNSKKFAAFCYRQCKIIKLSFY